MSKVSIYLNFESETETAFTFYKSIFNTEFQGGGFMRFGEVPPEDGAPEMSEEVKNLIMHVELPLIGDYALMGSDAPKSMGFNIKKGNNFYIMLQPDTRAETKRLFDLLSEGGIVEAQLQDMFWGDYYGSFADKFGVQWMLNCSEKV
ncbi:MAG TPA: VOC family protein [Paludibacter sp.]|nr:VOC family protein [Paludibacter sp.]